jgi:hypothetical protein
MLDGRELASGDGVIVHTHGSDAAARFLGVGAKSGKVYVAYPNETVDVVVLNDDHWIADPISGRAYTFGDPEVLDSAVPDME